mgnify:CR=1 FL=1
MKRLLFIIGCFFIGLDLFGQSCTHSDLSSVFRFITQVERINRGTESLDSCIITITILKKKSQKTLQTIKYSSTFIYENGFHRCAFVRSYSTGKNKKVEVLDNNYGDLVVADFNFDGKDDFAVVKESGVSDGPLYSFYIQSKAGRFSYDKYLSETVTYFPSNINPKKRTLTTYTTAGAIGVSCRIYKLNKSNKWTLVSKKLLTG